MSLSSNILSVLDEESFFIDSERARASAGAWETYSSTARGFEPLRAEPNGFLVHHLSHSVTLSLNKRYDHVTFTGRYTKAKFGNMLVIEKWLKLAQDYAFLTANNRTSHPHVSFLSIIIPKSTVSFLW